jgi:hypothetical protein
LSRRKGPLVAVRRPGVISYPGTLLPGLGLPPGPRHELPVPPGGMVAFSADDPVIDLVVSLGGEPAMIDDGYARWDLVERRRQRSITQFTGITPYRQTVPVVFDGYPDRSVESDIRLLERLATVPDGRDEPPVIRIVGAVRRTDLSWVISGIQWTNDLPVICDPYSGDRYRQAATVTLLQHVNDELLVESNNGRPGKAAKTERVREGERTLEDFCKRVYGTRSMEKVRAVAKANHLSVNAKLKPGQTLKLP